MGGQGQFDAVKNCSSPPNNQWSVQAKEMLSLKDVVRKY